VSNWILGQSAEPDLKVRSQNYDPFAPKNLRDQATVFDGATEGVAMESCNASSLADAEGNLRVKISLVHGRCTFEEP